MPPCQTQSGSAHSHATLLSEVLPRRPSAFGFEWSIWCFLGSTEVYHPVLGCCTINMCENESVQTLIWRVISFCVTHKIYHKMVPACMAFPLTFCHLLYLFQTSRNFLNDSLCWNHSEGFSVYDSSKIHVVIRYFSFNCSILFTSFQWSFLADTTPSLNMFRYTTESSFLLNLAY